MCVGGYDGITIVHMKQTYTIITRNFWVRRFIVIHLALCLVLHITYLIWCSFGAQKTGERTTHILTHTPSAHT